MNYRDNTDLESVSEGEEKMTEFIETHLMGKRKYISSIVEDTAVR